MAIAFDAAAEHAGATDTSITWSHTITGSDTLLIVSAVDSSSNLVTGVTYNGTSMTKVDSVLVPGDRYLHLYYLINPSTGTNDVVITASGSNSMRGFSTSYTGTYQVSQFDTNNTGSQSDTANYSDSITTTIDNCWTFMFAKNNTGTITGVESGTTKRGTYSTWATGTGDSGGVISPAATDTLGFTYTNSNADWASFMVSILPNTYSGSFIAQIIMG